MTTATTTNPNQKLSTTNRRMSAREDLYDDMRYHVPKSLITVSGTGQFFVSNEPATNQENSFEITDGFLIKDKRTAVAEAFIGVCRFAEFEVFSFDGNPSNYRFDNVLYRCLSTGQTQRAEIYPANGIHTLITALIEHVLMYDDFDDVDDVEQLWLEHEDYDCVRSPEGIYIKFSHENIIRLQTICRSVSDKVGIYSDYWLLSV